MSELRRLHEIYGYNLRKRAKEARKEMYEERKKERDEKSIEIRRYLESDECYKHITSNCICAAKRGKTSYPIIFALNNDFELSTRSFEEKVAKAFKDSPQLCRRLRIEYGIKVSHSKLNYFINDYSLLFKW